MPPSLVLASTSRYRRAQLEQLGLAFTCQAPGVDEAAATPPDSPPREIARALARAKAEAVAEGLGPEVVVLGGDQICVHEGTVLGKPGSVDRAWAQLLRLQGRSHLLITALCVAAGERRIEHQDVTELDMRSLSEEEIQRYVAADHPIDCAGSYKLESLGVTLFDAIRSEDHSAITGLPLLAVSRILRELGFQLP
jgi:septum formation protein